MSRNKKKKRHPPLPPRLPQPIEELAAIVERTTQGALSAEEHTKLKTALDTLASAMDLIAFLTSELQAKRTSLERLRHMLFGTKTEKTDRVLGEGQVPVPTGTAQTDKPDSGEGQAAPRTRPEGHGRNGAAAYTGAQKVHVSHPSLHRGDCCPGCAKGRVYPLEEPTKLVRITGMAPLGATVYECDRLRCNLCGEVFTAPAPPGVGNQKYDESAASMVGMVKYGTGVPFFRLEKLQAKMGIPLPASTQWELVQEAAQALAPVHEELVRTAAQSRLLHNDDTTMKILKLTREQRAAALAKDADEERTGVFTSGIVAIEGGRRIALFFTGARHAGENLADVLKRRSPDLPPPLQMCDGLSSNTANDCETVLCECIIHGRRNFVEVAGSFPEEVRFVLHTLAEVYKIDARARQEELTPEGRLQLHQTHSQPLMESLQKWMQAQFDERKVEPNSVLGKSIQYMKNHWTGMTRFLHVAGAPLDNNINEQALKLVVLFRKNSLFFKTVNGAHVGDVFMSLIHTGELHGINVFDYLVAVLRHREESAARPADWMPWNFQATLARLTCGPDPPA
jgi:transposase